MHHDPNNPPRKSLFIASGTLIAILLHLTMRFAFTLDREVELWPLFAVYIFGGIPLVYDLIRDLVNGKFGSDALAGISICTAFLLGEYLAGAVVVLMLSGGETLESFALARASSLLRELSKRIPAHAHRKLKSGETELIATGAIRVGDELVVLPHEICPVDGVVIEGHGRMDEAYLTGEPFEISKAPGSSVISGAVNGISAVTIRAERPFEDSRYARIMKVVEESEQRKPRLRRIGDQLGAFYTPFCLVIAIAAWAWSGEAIRFLAVLVVATPCPLIIAIPVAVIGSVSLAARKSIIIKNPAALEVMSNCNTVILDKTGTLTRGLPILVDEIVADGADLANVLKMAASLARYSKHPLSGAIIRCAEERGTKLDKVESLEEPPGKGIKGIVAGINVQITSRNHLAKEIPSQIEKLPPIAAGLECVIVIDGRYAATYRFRDMARRDSRPFVEHLSAKHGISRVMLVSGDRESEVRYLADQVGIKLVYAEKQPEDKVEIVKDEMSRGKVIFVGDGINDAPALNLATVGIAFGQGSDVTAGAADAVIMDTSLRRVDELFHIGLRMRRVALQSALGGIALSVLGMAAAFVGWLTPIEGAILQEFIDVAAVLNALRAGLPPKNLSDYGAVPERIDASI